MNALGHEVATATYADTPLEIVPTGLGKNRFALLPGETLAAALKRVLIGEIVDARAALADPAIDRAEAIHRVRRRLKRVRSLFFALAEVPGANRKNRAVQARDTARLLAGARDADVLAAEARRILARAEGRAVEAVALAVERLEAARGGRHGELPAIATIAARLAASEADARSLPDRFEAGRLLADAMVANYRRGRRDWRELEEGLSVAALHDWRKRVKTRRHLAALVPIETAVTTRAIQRDLDELGEILGEEHDLAVLAHRLRDDPVLLAPHEGRESMIELVGRRRRRLQRRALDLGDELYGMRTRDFAADLEELRPIC